MLFGEKKLSVSVASRLHSVPKSTLLDRLRIKELLEHDKEAADAIFADISFQKKTFKLRTKVETYQDVPKNKITVISITDPNYKEYNKHLLANIQRLTGIHKAENY
jgi:hypothetical protein